MSQSKTKKQNEQLYYVCGTHCASCELLIEKKLLDLSNVKSVEASSNKGEVLISYEGEVLAVSQLNKMFKQEGYSFSLKKENTKEPANGKNLFAPLIIAVLIIAGFLGLNKLGLSNLVNVSGSSSLPAFFLFGVLAGLSSCAALVGGLILSMSKQWAGIYGDAEKPFQRFKPHLMFNFGRILSYALLGALLGAIGSKLKLSLTFTSFLVFAVSAMMLVLALQMLGVKAFRRFQCSTPKFITRYVSNEKNFQGKYMPFLMGALTFFLPCGFTITAQGLALLSGNALQGGLIMLFFALGTLPVLLAIGLSSAKLVNNKKLSAQFIRVAGILVLFFALFNINMQLNVLGVSSLSDLALGKGNSNNNVCSGSTCNAGNTGNNNGGNIQEQNGLPEIIDGKQVIKMDASSSGYSPNYFKIRAGIPVRWEITDKGTSGCTNAVISKSLFSGDIPLTPGQVSIKEFTAQNPGKYKFSCWMGMVSGIMEVVDASSADNSNQSVSVIQQANADSSGVIPSGASGCGCGH